MAKGTPVVFASVSGEYYSKGTPAKPYLVPSGPVGLKAGLASFKRSIATLRTLSPSAIERAAHEAARSAAFAALDNARRKVPKATRTLFRSLNVRQIGPLSYSVGTNVKYARYVEEGTRAGMRNGPRIFPRFKKALAFRWRNAPPTVRARFRGRRQRRR